MLWLSSGTWGACQRSAEGKDLQLGFLRYEKVPESNDVLPYNTRELKPPRAADPAST